MDRRDDAGRRTVETIKGDTHDALGDAKERVKAGEGHELRGDQDDTTREARSEGVE